MLNKQFATKLAHAVILTVFTAGSIHLLVVFLASFVHSDWAQINPINFLGLNVLFPEWSDSARASIIGWFCLLGLGLLYLFLLIHYKRYLAIITATSRQERLQRVRELNAELKAMFFDADKSHAMSTKAKKSLDKQLDKINSLFQ